jgi:hypothetical protein
MKLLCRIAQGLTKSVDWFVDLGNSLFNKGKFIRRGIIVWLLIILSLILIFISKMDGLTPAQAIGLYNTTLGAFGGFTAFYIYLRNKDGD